MTMMILGWKVVSVPLMPDEDKIFSGSLVLDWEFDDIMCTHSIGTQ